MKLIIETIREFITESTHKDSIIFQKCNETAECIFDYLEINNKLEGLVKLMSLKSNSSKVKQNKINKGDFFKRGSLYCFWLNFTKDKSLSHSFVYVIRSDNVYIYQSYINRYNVREVILPLTVFRKKLLDVLLLTKDFHQSYNNLFDVEPCELEENEYVGFGFSYYSKI